MFDYKMYVELGNTMQRKIKEAGAAITTAEAKVIEVDVEVTEARTKKEQAEAVMAEAVAKKAEYAALVTEAKRLADEAEEDFTCTVLIPAKRALDKGHGGDRRSKKFQGNAQKNSYLEKSWGGFCKDINMVRQTADKKIEKYLGMPLEKWDITQYFKHAWYLVEEQGMGRPQAKAALEEYIKKELTGFDNSASTYDHKMFLVIESEHTDLKDKVAAGELGITAAHEIYMERKSGSKKERAKKREDKKKKKEREAKKAAKEKAKAEEQEAKAALRQKIKGGMALYKAAVIFVKALLRFVNELTTNPDIKAIIFDGVKANGGDITEKQGINLAENMLDVMTEFLNNPKKHRDMDKAFEMREVLIDNMQTNISWLSVIFWVLDKAFAGVCEMPLNTNLTGAQPTEGAETSEKKGGVYAP